MKISLKLLFLGLFLANSVFASEEATSNLNSQKNPEKKLTLEAIWKTPLHAILKFSDGREAQFLAEEFDSQKPVVKLVPTETNCPLQKTAVTCSIEIPTRSQVGALVWTQYPDQPQKIGQVVKRRYVIQVDSNGQKTFSKAEDVFLNSDISYELTTYKNQAVTENEKWKMTCDLKDFLKPLVSTHKKELKVYTMAGEISFSNNETGGNENRSFQMMEDVIFHEKSGTYSLESIGNLMGFIPLLLGQNLHWVTQSADNQFCEVSFSVNNSQLVQIQSTIDVNSLNPKKLKPIEWSGFLINQKTIQMKVRQVEMMIANEILE